MGDVILTTSLTRQIRKSFPAARIDFLISSAFSEIYRYNPRISNLFEYDKSQSAFGNKHLKSEMISSIGNSRYDIIIDLQNNLRSKVFAYGMYSTKYQVAKNRLNKLSLVYFKKSLAKNNIAIPEIHRNSVNALQLYDDKHGLEIWLENEKDSDGYPPFERDSKAVVDAGPDHIAIAPGAFHYTKRWLPDRYAELAIRLHSEFGSEITLLGGEKDRDVCKYISAKCDFDINDLSGSVSILGTTAQIDKCNLIITNDTGVMHIAAARQTPVVAIFGSTVTGLGFAPYRVENIIVEKDVDCRPCTHIGRDRCPKKHFNCMKLISADDVAEAVKKIVGG